MHGLGPDGELRSLRVDATGALITAAGGDTGGAAGSSNTTEATQVLVKAAVEGINAKTPDPVRKQVIDEVSATLAYIGDAPIGSATSAAVWRIKRVQATGAITTIEFSPAASVFDDRTSLGYT